MCNFYTRRLTVDELSRAFGFPERPNLEPRIVVRPTNVEHVVAVGQDGGRHLVPMRWGLVPPWAKDLKTGLTTTNARSETITEKGMFAQPFRKGRRCLVVLDGFFEFSGPKGAKQPHLFRPREGGFMVFAGLWEQWRGPREAPLDEPLLSYTFATTTANAVMAPLHHRMPVLLTSREAQDLWLSQDADEADLLALLRPAPDDLLEVFPIGRELLRLNEPGPEALERLNSA